MTDTPNRDDEAAARAAFDDGVRARRDAGDVDGATSQIIAYYGPELHGFLCALARDATLGGDAFAAACERIWRYLPRFRWEGSLRSWVYQLARSALHDLRSDPRRRLDRNLPLSVVTSIAEIPRTQTAPYQRTEVKDALRELRDALDPEEHEVLILRLDRAMSWKEIAVATSPDDGSHIDIDGRAATLRKRYERTKARLRELALARGLLPRGST